MRAPGDHTGDDPPPMRRAGKVVLVHALYLHHQPTRVPVVDRKRAADDVRKKAEAG